MHAPASEIGYHRVDRTSRMLANANVDEAALVSSAGRMTTSQGGKAPLG